MHDEPGRCRHIADVAEIDSPPDPARYGRQVRHPARAESSTDPTVSASAFTQQTQHLMRAQHAKSNYRALELHAPFRDGFNESGFSRRPGISRVRSTCCIRRERERGNPLRPRERRGRAPVAPRASNESRVFECPHRCAGGRRGRAITSNITGHSQAWSRESRAVGRTRFQARGG